MGRFVAPGLFLAERPGEGEISVRSGKVEAGAKIEVVNQIARLAIAPTTALLEPGASQEFTVTAYDDSGEEVYVDKSLYRWTASPGLGRMDPQTDRLMVTGKVANGQVKVRLGDSEAVAVINPVLEMTVTGQAATGQEVTLAVTHNGVPVAGAAVLQHATFGQVTASALNLRRGPGTGYQSLALLPRDTVMTVVSRLDNGWLRVLLNDGRQGFVSGVYVNLWEGIINLGQTDAGGRVAFSTAFPGRYTFEARKEGYLPGTLTQEFK
ncbi:MAG: SH3 domain-containing protein [Moorella sp. (in: Bacteria)]|nr:SH3 domain-containing protein [Moorella sp. (in: firmicutes)]